jgi:uncharacterized phiE125 gp8 family phage protein
MSLKLITPPSTLPVSLVEAKAHLRVDTSDDDTLITAMLGAAIQMAEQATGRALMTQTWCLSLDAFPLAAIELSMVPVASVTSLVYSDTLGADQTLLPSNYVLNNSDDYGIAVVVPAFAKTWPDSRIQANAVRLTFVAGYANAGAVPESIKSWIKLQVSAMYENRSAEATLKTHALGFADRLLDRYKVWSV